MTATPSPSTSTEPALALTGSDSMSLIWYAIGFVLVGGGLVVVGRQARKGRHTA
ncbi:hypothetical protein GCM10023107_29660 [Actinoplanes octamycinicus]